MRDDAIEEDELAGYLGVPFTQAENEDEDQWEILVSDEEDDEDDDSDNDA